MIVDSSAIMAILNDEPESRPFAVALASATNARMSAGTLVELSIVIDGRRDPVRTAWLDSFLARSRIAIVDVTAEQAKFARDAHRDFGRGSGHPARLNFGDCFSYALAKATGEPLLFKGDDFGHTDLTPAVGA
jgi:ribonuclease VapC